MIVGFDKLSDTQIQITKDAIAWISVLIAGADGKIDKDETTWAKKVTEIRGYHNPNELTPFYEAVGEEYGEKLVALLNNAPKDTAERQAILTRKLEQLNDILPLLDEDNIGYKLLKDYRSFAKHVAQASGGFFGFGSISNAEHKVVDLKMLNDIEWVEPADEEE